MSDLKSTYKSHLAAFTVLNVIVFGGIFIFDAHFSVLLDQLKNISLKEGAALVLTPIITLIISGWLPADAKARIVYWRIKNPLPGTRAFSELMNTDPRIDTKELRSKYGELPQEPSDQNRLWYKMLKLVEHNPAISQSHRDWLFSRDLTGYSLVFFFGFGISAFFGAEDVRVPVVYSILLFVQYVVIMISARTYGERLVKNVLAIAVVSEKAT